MNLVNALDKIDGMQRRGAMAVKAFYGHLDTRDGADIAKMIGDILAFAKAKNGNPKMICALAKQHLEIAEHDVINSETTCRFRN